MNHRIVPFIDCGGKLCFTGISDFVCLLSDRSFDTVGVFSNKESISSSVKSLPPACLESSVEKFDMKDFRSSLSIKDDLLVGLNFAFE